MDEAADDALAFGIGELVAEIASAEKAEAQAYKVWPENWDIVVAFSVVSSQLNVVSIGCGMEPSKLHYVGLNYPGVEVGLRGAGIDVSSELWAGIRVMETAMCSKLNGVEPPFSDVTTDGA